MTGRAGIHAVTGALIMYVHLVGAGNVPVNQIRPFARRLVPEWARGYDGRTARADAFAGLTVAVLLVPQAMAYAALAGLPPVTGLYAATLPLVVYALLGTSGQLAVGPVAIVALLTSSAIGPLAGGPTEAVGLAALLALLVGAIQIALAALRLAWVTGVLTHAVIVGFTAAAAIVIALSQARALLGVDAAGGGTALDTVAAVAGALGTVHAPTVAVAAVGIGLLLTLRRWAPRSPAFLLLLVAGAVTSMTAGLPSAGVAVVGDIPAGLPTPALPPLDAGTAVSMLPAAAAIALIGHAEGWSVARAIARRAGGQPRAGRELMAVGSANLAAGLISAFPVAGGFSRSAVNHEAGARTPAAGLVTAALIALVATAATPLLEPLPGAVLAAVIVVAVLRLIDLPELARMVRHERAHGLVATVTFAATLSLGVEAGLIVGVVAALVVDAAARLARARRRSAAAPAARTPVASSTDS